MHFFTIKGRVELEVLFKRSKMYLKNLQLLSIITLAICSYVTSLDVGYLMESRIIGGTDEQIENAPWQISLQLLKNMYAVVASTVKI